MEYHPAMTRNDATTQVNLQSIMPNKKSQTQKTILYNPMNILNSRKGKTIIIGKQISQEPREGEKKTDCSKGA